ncbi:MAG: GHKL domain-containing protein [Oscillospiraceae bacterium]|nr:GHKL domain-containing protein [Oscillospiraceae bacterium]
MIKKLKMRFVIVNMIILSLVLLATLSGIYLLMVNSEIKMSEEIMDTLIENHKKDIPMPIEKSHIHPDGMKPLVNGETTDYINIVPMNNPQDNHGHDYGYYDPYWYYYYNGWWGNPPQDSSNNWGNGYWDGGWGDPQWQWGTPPPDFGSPPNDLPPDVTDNTHPKPETTVTDTSTSQITTPVTEPASSEPITTEEITTQPPEVIPTESYTEPPVYTEENVPLTEPITTTVTTTAITTTTSQTVASTTLPPPLPTEKRTVTTTRYNGNLIRSHIFAELGKENEVLNISYQYFFRYEDDTSTDENYDQQIRKTIREISENGKPTGKCIINSVSYRYKMTSSPNSKNSSVIFLDRSIEMSTLNRLLIIFVIIGCAGLIIVFFISLFLANWAIKPIEDAWNKQKQFIADASHELKTPLTVIAANTDVVLSTPNDTIKNQERWLKYIKSETLRMSKLVNELLYIAKSDSNEIKMEMNEFDISNTVSSLCLIFESLVFEAGRELATDISPKLRFYGDEDRIKQLITILLDNATKYSIVNSVISVSLFRNNQGKIKLCISNKCEDLSEENVSKLFDRFYRVDTSRNSGTGGNGLGLNIAQNIAEAHNGNIQVHYNYGMISFTITF